MGRIHVNRDRQNLGQFTSEEVTEGLASGRFLPTDLAWREGMEAWQPLSAFTDLPPPGESEAMLASGSVLEDLPLKPAEVTPAWERDSGGWLARASETVREIFSDPVATFRTMPRTGGLKKPLVFTILMSTLFGLVSLFYSLVFELLKPPAAAHEVPIGITITIYAVVAVLMPGLVALGSFISSGIFHVCLMIVGAAPKSFESTFRICCYTSGSTAVLLLIPICGGLVQTVWSLCVMALGFREVHGTTTGKAVFAVLLPMVVCCSIGIGAAFLAATIAPALSQAAQQ